MADERRVPSLRDHLYLRRRRDKQAERAQLGFLRQPRVRWLSPPILLKAGVEVAVSSTFGQFADKRELETAEQEAPFDYSDREELWIDYLCDTGDSWEATYTMAWLLTKSDLATDLGPLPRGDLLLLGGDQVYPAPGEDGIAYEDRFVGPFSAAARDDRSPRDLFAVPGNHDWYDGLISFLRIFCRPERPEEVDGGTEMIAKQIGDWRTRQTRSYWALRLPHDWWIWAIDIQLDTYIDNAQMEYFARLRGELEKGGQRVVLITAKPSWVKAEKDNFAPASWRNLAYFEQEMIRKPGGELVLTLTGDLHHYSRYESREAAGPSRITAGGGGAYLSATHSLPEDIHLVPKQGERALPYRRAEIYPRKRTSRGRSWGVFLIPWHNPGFAALLGAIYALLAIAAIGSLNAGAKGLVAQAQEGGFASFLDNAGGGATIVVAAILALILIAYADFSRPAKLVAGLIHALPHLALAAAVIYLVAQPFEPTDEAAAGLVAAAIAAELLTGFVVGSFVFALYLFIVHHSRGDRSPKHTNEVFASQGIRDYKNFLRLHIDREGRLTVHALGVRRISRRWELQGTGARPRFAPGDGKEPTVELIDDLLAFPRSAPQD